MPVPGGSLEAEMLAWREMAGKRAEQAYAQEYGPDDDVEAMKAGGHEEDRAIDIAAILLAEGKGRMAVFIGLNAGEENAEDHRAQQAPHQPLAIVVEQRMMRPG